MSETRVEGWRIGADIGGTFTDIILLSPAGELHTLKTLTTYDDFSRAIAESVADRLGADGCRQVVTFVHGTTVATNAILEEQTPEPALVTTAGMRDVLELRRGRRPTLYDLSWVPPRALVPRRLRLEVDERVDGEGNVVRELDRDSVERCAEAIRAAGVPAVAICLLNSFANGDHEREVERLLRERLPDVAITASSAIAPEPKEYERTSTTVVNALLIPVVDEYLARLESSLTGIGIDCPIQVMQSDSTTAAPGTVREVPYLIIESGPAAGVVAAARLAEELDRRRVITFDMGGTTAKAALVEDFRVGFADKLEVGASHNHVGGLLRGDGYTVTSPCVDLSEVGAGGGSIAWLDSGGVLRVGPRSAGSDPGPACYGLGGELPTVTDAHVVLGYLNPVAIADGQRPIHRELAERAIDTLAEPLGLDRREVALGIYRVATSNMRRAVRAVSVERGRDPREFSLFSFGGGGGLHAAALALDLEMSEVVIPVVPGVFSSLGLLFADLAVTRTRALRAPLDAGGVEAIRSEAAALADEATAALRAQGDHPGTLTVELSLGLRFVGQSSALTLPLESAAALERPEEIARAFVDEHRRTYGHAPDGEPVEVVTVRARAAWVERRPSFAEMARARSALVARREPTERELYFGGGESVVCPVLSRADIGPEGTPGPLVIEEPESTIVVPAEFEAVLDPTGSIVLRAREQEAA